MQKDFFSLYTDFFMSFDLVNEIFIVFGWVGTLRERYVRGLCVNLGRKILEFISWVDSYVDLNEILYG